MLASEMCSGKTAVAEAILGYELSQPDSKACYVSPLKAITHEKFSSWSEAPEFKRVGLALLAGDSKVGTSVLDSSGLILATIESLDIRLRKKQTWTTRLNALIFDEAHLLGDSSRGTEAEAMLMNLASLNRDCRIVLLSGTLNNVHQLATWLKKLNGKKTHFIKSGWRPVHLEKKVAVVKPNGFFEMIMNEVMANPYDKMLVFVHSKKLGVSITKQLIDEGIGAAFFSADLTKPKRLAMASKFKNSNSGLNVLIATSALGMGVDL